MDIRGRTNLTSYGNFIFHKKQEKDSFSENSSVINGIPKRKDNNMERYEKLKAFADSLVGAERMFVDHEKNHRSGHLSHALAA